MFKPDLASNRPHWQRSPPASCWGTPGRRSQWPQELSSTLLGPGNGQDIGHPLILCSAFLLQVIGCLGPVRRTLKSPSTVSSGNSQLWPATRSRNPSCCLVEEDDGLSKVGGSLRKVAA